MVTKGLGMSVPFITLTTQQDTFDKKREQGLGGLVTSYFLNLFHTVRESEELWQI